MVLEIDVNDSATYAKYVERVPATIEKFGGRYLVRGGRITSMEGGWNPERVVILEFPNLEQLKKWNRSPEYQELALLRAASTESRAFAVEGYQPF
jgi:uncharacterized protein (DUF1330 family)